MHRKVLSTFARDLGNPRSKIAARSRVRTAQRIARTDQRLGPHCCLCAELAGIALHRLASAPERAPGFSR